MSTPHAVIVTIRDDADSITVSGLGLGSGLEVIVTIRDNGNYVRVLLYSITITGWVAHLNDTGFRSW